MDKKIIKFFLLLLLLSILTTITACSNDDKDEVFTYQISGEINGLEELGDDEQVIIDFAGDYLAVETTGSGAERIWKKDEISDGVLTVTPKLEGYTFEPKEQDITVDGENVHNVDFSAKISDSTAIPASLSISVDYSSLLINFDSIKDQEGNELSYQEGLDLGMDEENSYLYLVKEGESESVVKASLTDLYKLGQELDGEGLNPQAQTITISDENLMNMGKGNGIEVDGDYILQGYIFDEHTEAYVKLTSTDEYEWELEADAAMPEVVIDLVDALIAVDDLFENHLFEVFVLFQTGDYEQIELADEIGQNQIDEAKSKVEAISDEAESIKESLLQAIEGAESLLEANEFAGGVGSEDDPFLIANANHLNNVRNYPKSYFLQVDNIEMDELNTENSWIPIGRDEDFSGYYDGDGFSITNLVIAADNMNNIGLFSELKSGAKIKGVNLINVDITGGDYVGALAGQTATDVLIENSSASGKITGDSYIGGLIGYNRAKIDNSATDITIEADSNVGGLVGELYRASISDSEASGNIIATGSRVGGLVGSAIGKRDEDDGKGDIISSSAYGNVTASQEDVGGLIGRSIDNKVLESHSHGEVVGKDDSVGGLIGNAGRVRIDNSTTNSNVIGTGQHVGGFIGTQGVYGIAGGNISNSFAYGDVTGKASQVGGFSGYLWAGEISNSGAYGNVNGEGERVGGFIGEIRYGIRTVKNSYAKGDVNANSSYVGGFVGRLVGFIEECYASGNVSGDGDYVGGFAGFNAYSTATDYTIRRSYYAGEVDGSGEYIGGFVGDNRGAILNSYAIGKLEADSESDLVGGFVGRNGGWSDIGIVNSFAAVEVTVPVGVSAGGFLSNEQYPRVVVNSYFDKSINADTAINLLYGRTTTEMQSQANFSDWDFVNIWQIDENQSYPYLGWE